MIADSSPRDSASARRVGALAALVTLIGALASGPIAMLIVARTHPQPPWQDARLWAENFHPIQTLPFFFGFFLVGGFVVLVASVHTLAERHLHARTYSALVFVSAFASLVLFNYAVQTTFLPALARGDVDANGPILAAFSMSHPSSLGWGLEMWGYAWLGLATWLVAPVFSGTRLQRATAWTFAANGPVSLLSALWTALRPGWVMTTPGLLAFAIWNALVIAMTVLAFAVLRTRIAVGTSPAETS